MPARHLIGPGVGFVPHSPRWILTRGLNSDTTTVRPRRTQILPEAFDPTIVRRNFLAIQQELVEIWDKLTELDRRY
jgi:hypothetical protein